MRERTFENRKVEDDLGPVSRGGVNNGELLTRCGEIAAVDELRSICDKLKVVPILD